MIEAFDSAVCTLMARALDAAWRRITAGDVDVAPAKRTKTAVAHAIMEAAAHGVRREAELVEYALLHYRLTRTATTALH